MEVNRDQEVRRKLSAGTQSDQPVSRIGGCEPVLLSVVVLLPGRRGGQTVGGESEDVWETDQGDVRVAS